MTNSDTWINSFPVLKSLSPDVSENGRKVVLFRVTAKESCTLTTACLMGYEDDQAESRAGSPT